MRRFSRALYKDSILQKGILFPTQPTVPRVGTRQASACNLHRSTSSPTKFTLKTTELRHKKTAINSPIVGLERAGARVLPCISGNLRSIFRENQDQRREPAQGLSSCLHTHAMAHTNNNNNCLNLIMFQVRLKFCIGPHS